MPRPASLDRNRILSAADALLRRHGFAGLTMRALAARLGVDPMAVYYHLPSRDAVVAALAAERVAPALMSDSVVARSRLRIQRHSRWRTRLMQLALSYWRGVAGQPELVRALTARVAASAELSRDWEARVNDALSDTRATASDRREVAHALADLVHGAALAPVDDQSAAEQSTRRAVTLLLDGVDRRLEKRTGPRASSRVHRS
ncbi:MAG: TetR/AcrR family transcriptional regulator [Gemmatimonadaceae bacterium]|nr:TetR/AcrR family transcriptional regulator [Gemmatimonadaceae bacterium]